MNYASSHAHRVQTTQRPCQNNPLNLRIQTQKQTKQCRAFDSRHSSHPDEARLVFLKEAACRIITHLLPLLQSLPALSPFRVGFNNILRRTLRHCVRDIIHTYQSSTLSVITMGGKKVFQPLISSKAPFSLAAYLLGARYTPDVATCVDLTTCSSSHSPLRLPPCTWIEATLSILPCLCSAIDCHSFLI